MKLLLDENLSRRILRDIERMFPGSAHVKDRDLITGSDEAIWAFAKT
jgi:predicted nuclease of predicted toxin-antitoxin system